MTEGIEGIEGIAEIVCAGMRWFGYGRSFSVGSVVSMDGYKRLTAWQKCRLLALAVYRATDAFPPAERFGLAAQLRRAAISSCANLAEGHGRLGAREFARFIRIALGSLAEIDALLGIAGDLGYLPEEASSDLHQHYLTASKTTYGLLKGIRRPTIPSIPSIN